MGGFSESEEAQHPLPHPCHLMPPDEAGTPNGSLKADFQDRKMCS